MTSGKMSLYVLSLLFLGIDMATNLDVIIHSAMLTSFSSVMLAIRWDGATGGTQLQLRSTNS